MFVLIKPDTYTWPVKTETPKAGKHEKEDFEVTFKRISDSEVKKYFVETSPEADRLTDKEFCKKVVCGWKHVKDGNGDDIEFSSSALEQMLEIPGISKFIITAFLESLAGSKVKN